MAYTYEQRAAISETWAAAQREAAGITPFFDIESILANRDQVGTGAAAMGGIPALRIPAGTLDRWARAQQAHRQLHLDNLADVTSVVAAGTTAQGVTPVQAVAAVIAAENAANGGAAAVSAVVTAYVPPARDLGLAGGRPSINHIWKDPDTGKWYTAAELENAQLAGSSSSPFGAPWVPGSANPGGGFVDAAGNPIVGGIPRTIGDVVGDALSGSGIPALDGDGQLVERRSSKSGVIAAVVFVVALIFVWRS